MNKLLITGTTGFVGGHLLQHLATSKTWQVLPTAPFDLCNQASLEDMLRPSCPDAVIHLAGKTFVPESFRDPATTFQINLLGTLNLLQALKARGFNGTFLYVSSGDVYGQVETNQLPISESLPPNPRNPYAVSKLSAELLCRQWGHSEDWRILIARPFNHIGSGQNPSFVLSSVARQLVRIQKNLQPAKLAIGDVDVTRDFLDVRDVTAAYILLLENGCNGSIYNVCSGQERLLRDLIIQMSQLAGLEVELHQDEARMRRTDQRRVVGSAEKLQEETGWRPRVSITETLQSMLSDWARRELE
ncbi:GDP-mannose 4,6-dehydratase [Ectopseudomonas mendocina]|uniref:GDP-mannose 4,6-dehydratase n=1 Tax=Ectopseudomonas mendocina TaxID=300 RepID=A0ABZ2RN21_ECTME